MAPAPRLRLLPGCSRRLQDGRWADYDTAGRPLLRISSYRASLTARGCRHSWTDVDEILATDRRYAIVSEAGVDSAAARLAEAAARLRTLSQWKSRAGGAATSRPTSMLTGSPSR